MRVSLAEAIALLKRGEVVAIPTETVYGLAADASNDAALQKIYALKQRPANNPLIIHLSGADQVTQFAAEFPPLAQKMAKAFWPGPFTLILKSKPDVSQVVRAHADTVALRVPNHPVSLQLLQESHLALAAPSANRYTQLSPTTAEHVEAGLGADVPVLDGGACQVGIESTIVSVDGDTWQLLRHGMISTAQIEAVAGKLALDNPKQVPKAPGQHLLHYSPRTPSLLFQQRVDLLDYAKQHANCVALLIGGNTLEDKTASNLMHIIKLSDQPAQAAEHLYEALHQLDQLKAQAILIELPPPTEAWAAILDRLTRAGYRENN
jgi:L-threonylcarbamoyladenylate synthase